MGLFSSSKPPGSSESLPLKSAAIATLGGTQISLTLLEKMTDGVPLPFVKATAATAVEIIKIARVIQSNGRECDDLIKRSSSLLVVVLDSFNRKTETQIPSDLKGAVERLSRNFHEVLAELKVIESRAGKGSVHGKLKAGLYHFDNAEKLRGCSSKLDWALQEFQVTSKVESCLKDLERHEELRKAQMELKDGQVILQTGQGELRDGQNAILDAMKTNQTAGVILSLPSTVMPANPRIFGREDYIATAINLMTSNNAARLAILGPGGIGKTSVALKIVHNTQVIDKFGKQCHWVPCEQATSINLLVELLAKSLNLPSSKSNDRLGDVVTFLESSAHLHLILLDNFETPWDIPGEQSNVADILSRLGAIDSTSFILTMRGSHHPVSDRINWSKPRLPSLAQLVPSAAHEAFSRIAPDAASDPQLGTLLEELDCMPLAITLMARLADAGEQPSQLLLQWRSERTRLLSQPEGDRRNSIEISIKLSMESRAVKGHSDAINLLSILALLPAGAYLSRLPDICPSIPNWRAALRVLHDAALVYHGADKKSVHVLSPIRSYVLLHHPLGVVPSNDLQEAYFKLAARGKIDPGEDGFLENVKEFGWEKANLETILMDALSQKGYGDMDRVINASLNYSSFLYFTQPQISIITAAADSARATGSTLLAECLQLLGDMLYMQSQDDDARSHLEAARAEFLKLEDHFGATRCLQSLGEILYVQGNDIDAYSAFETARAEFIRLGSQSHAAYSLRSLGESQLFQSRFDDAILSLEMARDEFVGLGDTLGTTQCLEILGNVLRRTGKYDEASSNLMEAMASYTSMGSSLGVANTLAALGGLSHALKRYDVARNQLEEAREKLTSLQQDGMVAWCTEELKLVHEEQNQLSESIS